MSLLDEQVLMNLGVAILTLLGVLFTLHLRLLFSYCCNPSTGVVRRRVARRDIVSMKRKHHSCYDIFGSINGVTTSSQ